VIKKAQKQFNVHAIHAIIKEEILLIGDVQKTQMIIERYPERMSVMIGYKKTCDNCRYKKFLTQNSQWRCDKAAGYHQVLPPENICGVWAIKEN
jgi:hypothetical protein